MKRKSFFIIFVSLSFVMLCLVPSPVLAENADDLQEQLEEEISANLAELDLDEFEAFAQALDSDFFKGESIKSFVKKLTDGELSLSPREIISVSFSYVSQGVLGALPFFVSIILVAVLFSLVLGLTQDFLNKQTVEIVYFVCLSAVIGIVVTMLVKTVGEVTKAVDSLTKVVNTFFPALITLMTLLGGNATSAVFKPQIAFMCAMVVNVISKVVIPLFIASVVLSISGNLSQNVKLDKLQSTARYLAKIVLSVTFGGFITYLTLSGLVGGISDTVSAKAAKYLVSSYVPILGGYLSQGFDLISASLVLIKNSLGVAGVLTVLAVTLTPVFKLVALTVGLKLTAGVIEPIADKRMSSMINGISECVRQLVGATLGVGFVFIASIMMVVLTLNVF